jgi:hypothetical protein
MAATTQQTGDKGKQAANPSSSKEKELKTEGPLSEKDEVKKAEQKMNKAAKKQS